MATRSYRSARTRKREVRYEKEVPKGNWATVMLASEITGRSRTSIYMQFFRGDCDGFRLKDGPLYVSVDEIR
jgi:hypothetical protein